MSIENRLHELGISLPELPTPAGNYVHAVRSGNLMFLSAKGPVGSTGKVGVDVSVEDAYRDARQAGLILLSVLQQELGTLDRVTKVLKVFGMVNATSDFEDHPAVINGCSDLLVEVFGERGPHARSAIGVHSLPARLTVAIDAVVEVLG